MVQHFAYFGTFCKENAKVQKLCQHVIHQSLCTLRGLIGFHSRCFNVKNLVTPILIQTVRDVQQHRVKDKRHFVKLLLFFIAWCRMFEINQIRTEKQSQNLLCLPHDFDDFVNLLFTCKICEGKIKVITDKCSFPKCDHCVQKCRINSFTLFIRKN